MLEYVLMHIFHHSGIWVLLKNVSGVLFIFFDTVTLIPAFVYQSFWITDGYVGILRTNISTWKTKTCTDCCDGSEAFSFPNLCLLCSFVAYWLQGHVGFWFVFHLDSFHIVFFFVWRLSSIFYFWHTVTLLFQESLLLRERICNFFLYKAVFLFGVLNSVIQEEVIAWVLWFAILAAVAALQSIVAYRLKYVRF